MRLRTDCLAKGEFGNGRQNKDLRVGGALRILSRSSSSTHCRLLDPSTYDDIAGTRANQIRGFRIRRCLSNTGPRERLGVHHRITRTLTTSPFSFLSKQNHKDITLISRCSTGISWTWTQKRKKRSFASCRAASFSHSTVLLGFHKAFPYLDILIVQSFRYIAQLICVF